MLGGLYNEHTGDIEKLGTLWPNVEAALHWIDGRGDLDQDGLVAEYHRADEQSAWIKAGKQYMVATLHYDLVFRQSCTHM
jgi:glycogen debranching enzyme